MNLLFNELFLFSTQDKSACKISFSAGINVITSSQIDGTDRGKSVIMRSLYHSLGADALYDDKWDSKNKVYVLSISIDSDRYFIYRAADLFKFFDSNKKLLFSTANRHELSEKLIQYTHFGVQLPNRNTQKLELTPPVFNYVLNFLDQDHYDGTKFTSFDRLAQYANSKEFILYYHLGVYDNAYFEMIREKEEYTDSQNELNKREAMLTEMQKDVESKIGSDAVSWSIESLKSEIDLYHNEYTSVLSSLNLCKDKLLSLRNAQFEAEQSLKELELLTKKNEKEITTLHEHRCPECNSVLNDTIVLKSKRYNLSEDIISIKNSTQTSLLDLSKEINEQEHKYSILLNELHAYEEQMKLNNTQVNDILRFKGLCEIRDGVIAERKQLRESIQEITNRLSTIKKSLKKYNEKKKSVNEEYYKELISIRTRFGLNEINPDSFKSITINFMASGSNKPIATVMWYLALLKLRNCFNNDALSLPIVFDSPNNAETDDTKRHALLQFILDETKNYNQLILSSIGFESQKFDVNTDINSINLINDKYHLLDEESYVKYYPLLKELCDAE